MTMIEPTRPQRSDPAITARSPRDKERTNPWPRLVGPRVVLLVAVAALVTGCGDSNAAVASVSSSSTSTNSAGAPSSARQTGLLYASCMRAHGIANFPDSAVSVIGGRVEIHLPQGIKREAGFLSASQACQKDLPVSSGTSAKKTNIPDELKFARCMRSHGITNFPDPTPGGGFNIPGDTNSPQFEAAAKACQWTGIHWNGP